jgi:hypothetical protein
LRLSVGESAKLRVAITAIHDQESQQRAHTLQVRVIDDEATVAFPAYQPCARQNAEVRGQGILLTSDLLGERTGG